MNEIEGQFDWLWENTQNYKTCSIPIEKEVTEIDKNGEENVTNIKFVDSAVFMISSLSNNVNNFAKEIHKIWRLQLISWTQKCQWQF